MLNTLGLRFRGGSCSRSRTQDERICKISEAWEGKRRGDNPENRGMAASKTSDLKVLGLG